MKKIILGLIMLSSVSAFADETYKCTFYTAVGPEVTPEVIVEDAIISYGNFQEIQLNNGKIQVSFEDGDFVESNPSGIYKGMNLLSVKFYRGKDFIVMANAVAAKQASIISAQTLSYTTDNRFTMVHCIKK